MKEQHLYETHGQDGKPAPGKPSRPGSRPRDLPAADPGDARSVESPAAGYDTVPAARVNPARGQGAREIGGRGGPDPTRYGDWEKAGRCIDF